MTGNKPSNTYEKSSLRGGFGSKKPKKNKEREESQGNITIKIHAAHGKLIEHWIKENEQCDYSSIDDGLFQPNWHEEHKDLFETDWLGYNFIHRAITQIGNGGGDIPGQISDIIQRMILERPESFTLPDNGNISPMVHAAKYDMSFLFEFLDLLIPESALEDIRIPCSAEQTECPLKQVHVMRMRHAECRRNMEIEANKEQTENNSDVDTKVLNVASESCLHGKIDINDLIRSDTDLRNTLKNALESLETQAYPCLLGILQEKNFDEDDEWRDERLRIFKIFLQLCPDSLFQLSDGEKTPLQMAIQVYSKTGLDYDFLFDVVQALIDRAPWSIFVSSGSRNADTAYSMLQKHIHRKDTPPDTPVDKAMKLLKETCIGYQGPVWDAKENRLHHQITSEDKIRYLYPGVELEKQLCLNLTGASENIDRSYINTMKNSSGLMFETALELVRLPYWRPQQIQGFQKPNQPAGDSMGEKLIDSDPYIDLFHWIRSSGTTKVFTLDVDDDGSKPHTNYAIRKALTGERTDEGTREKPFPTLEIKVWKWKKFDICTDTIALAAPKAQHVYLWSTGNLAVLKGWACGPGLSKLEELRNLHVMIYPKNERDSEDCLAYEESFKSEVNKKCPKLMLEGIVVECYPKYDSGIIGSDEGATDPGNRAASKSPRERKQKASDWIKELESFTNFMHNLIRKQKLKIKVAVIDDGCRLLDFQHIGLKGRSFCANGEAYFAGRCDHGTEMVRCIRQVCPSADFCIARLDGSRQLDNQSFTLQSCCKALKWALDVEADVISMSWTFTLKTEDEDEYQEEFIDLIKKAVEKNILLFGSLPDGGPTVQIDRLAPVGLDGVIRIGSATAHGERTSDNLFADLDFLFPGEERLVDGEFERGSSYATAYASGLAAMILLTVKAYGRLATAKANGVLTKLEKDEDFQKALLYTRTADGMREIFKRLSLGDAESQKRTGFYVGPYQALGRESSHFNMSDDGQIKTLQRIVKKILPTHL